MGDQFENQLDVVREEVVEYNSGEHSFSPDPLSKFVSLSQGTSTFTARGLILPQKYTEASLMLGAEIRPAVRKTSDLGEIYNLLNHSLALGTIANYKSVIGKFARFLSNKEKDIAVFTREDLEQFLGEAGDQNLPFSFWANIKPALMWLEKILDRKETVFYGQMNLLIQGGQRFSALTKPPVQKPEAIDASVLRSLIDIVVLPYLHDMFLIHGEHFRSLFKEVLKFKTLCRFDCYSKLQAFHFSDHGSRITIYFPGAKNDQYHQGNMAVLDSNDSPYCPVLLTRLYFNRFGLKFGNSDVQDINFVNFKVRNKQITRTVQGV